MMEKLLKMLPALLAAVLVFGTALYLDNVHGVHTVETQPRESWVWETETTETTEAAEEPAQQQTEPTETLPADTESQQESFQLTFVGDCTLGCRDGHSYIDLGYTKVIGEDYGYPFRNVVDYFTGDDFTMVNLEGALCDKGHPVEKAHTFRGPTAYVNILTGNSVEAVTLANNHTLDYGRKGYDTTVATLETAGVPYVERDSSTIVTTESGLTVGIYGAVYYLFDEADMTAEIAALSEQADVVVFAPHWGVEGTYAPTKEQTRLAHVAIDAGADIVYGSHPHVLQPMEAYNGGIIYYSLGNFSFGGNIYPDDYDTALIQQEVIRAADGTVSLGQTRIVPASLSSVSGKNNYQPTPYPKGTPEYDRVLAKLSGTWEK